MATDTGSFSKARDIGSLNRTRTFSDSVSKSNKLDFYKLSLGSRSILTGALSDLTNNANLTFFDANRQRIAQSKKSGTQSESIATTLDAGTYYVRIDRKSGNPTYKLKLSATPFIPIDSAGNTQTTARALTVGSTASTLVDSVGANDTDDFYKFDATGPSNLNATLAGLSGNGNADLQILNSSGVAVASSANTGTTQDALNVNLAAGTYFVRVSSAASNPDTDYSLNLALTSLKLVGLGDNNTLLAFNPDNTKAVSVAVTGLAAGETLRGIDFRPKGGQLYGLGSTSRLYTIDPTTGAATQVGSPFSTALSGSSFGFDFNPAVDRIRVVSDTDQNLRLNPDTGAIAGIDTPITYAVTDTNASQDPTIVGSAYSNNVAGNPTTLFGIDSTLDTLVTQGSTSGSPTSPNTGQLFTVGKLGVDLLPNTGFDIFTDANQVDSAFAVSGSTLYGINLTTGAAKSLGTVTLNGANANVTGLAARLPA
jgi:hypothetical protein